MKPEWVPPKWLSLVIATVFFVVGVVATSNSIRLNRYINQTLPRDTQQEACQLATLQSLRVWATGRGQIEDAKTKRDHALIPLLTALEHGNRPSPEVAEAADREFVNVEAVRINVTKMMEATPIPKCELLGKNLR